MTTTEHAPICSPEHGPHYARGLCRRCYGRHRDAYPRRNRTSTALAAAAAQLYAEFQAAGPYAGFTPTWVAVARHLGVKPKTLEKARERAKQYAARELS